MDLELKAYLDTHFAQMGDRIDTRLDGIDTRLDRMDARLDRMDARLDGIDTRLDRMDARLDGMGSRLDGLEDDVRQTRILVEGQRDDIRQLAEGIIGTNESLAAFRIEVQVQLDKIPGLITPAYTALDGRVRTLESWKERTDRDPVEIVRERWGRPKTT